MPRLLLLAALIAIGAMAARYAADSDTWWHLATGRWIVAHGAIPTTDVFSHTQAGTAWHIPGWPAQLLLYGVYQLGGDLALSALAAVIVLAAFAAIASATSAEQPFVRVVALLFAAVVSSIYWAARPALLSFLFAAITLAALRRPLSRSTWIALPIIMLLWANIHGGFAIGFILIGLALLGHATRWLFSRSEEDRRAVLALAACCLTCAGAACLNPYGFEMLVYPFKTVGLQALGLYIQEWQPPDLSAPLGQAFLAWVVVTLAVAALAWRRIEGPGLVVFLGATAMAFSAARHVPLAALAGVPVFTTGLSGLLAARLGDRATALGNRPGLPALNAVVLVLVIVLAGVRWLVSSTPASLPIDSPMRPPTAAVAALKVAALPGPLFNAYDFGGYLIWALPEQPTFIDGRTDLFPVDQFRDYVTIESGGDEALAVLERYGVRTAIVRAGVPIDAALAAAPAWLATYRDDIAAVYTLR